ncbi:MAG: ABC transporter ATP-binding protein [Acutalibacteraceae bacterium]|nr:ABC transporter ATP-binding protein [Acutalibacteraceae bacterium]
MNVYGKLLWYVSEIKREIAVKTLLLLASSATYILQAILMASVVNLVFSDGSLKSILVRVAVVVAAILVRGFILRYIETYTRIMAARIKEKLRMSLLSKIYDLGPGYMSGKRSGKVTSLVLDGIEALEPFYVRYVPQIITVLVSGTFVFCYLVRYDAVSALALIASMLLCVVVPLATVPAMDRTVTDYWTDYSTLTSQYIDSIQGMTTLKTLDAEQSMGEVLRRDATAFWKRSIRNTGISLSNSALMFILTSVTSSLTVVLAAIRAMHGIVPATAVTAFLFLAVECARPMIELNSAWHASFLGMSVAKEMFGLMEMDPPVKDPEDPVLLDVSDRLPEIRFDAVRFFYPGREEEVLHGVTFAVPPGSTTAVVGPSGAGKSTILSLVLRFYDVTGGSVTFNGTDIRRYALRALQDQIGVVFQDTYLFYGTIAENIRMARPDASDEEVREAATAANAHDFIMAFPDGYETIVGERGVTLSGGERQRISIARAILKDAPVLLLDEATSSVDAESESLIQSALSELTKQRTTIIVAHRLSTVRGADNIIVLNDGMVAEQGTHGELMAADGVYRSLIRAQEESSQ